jgi:hypothetical protein
LKLNLDEFESANHAIDGDFNLDLEDFKSAKNLLDSGAKIDLDNLDSDRQSSQSSHHDLLPEKAVYLLIHFQKVWNLYLQMFLIIQILHDHQCVWLIILPGLPELET